MGLLLDLPFGTLAGPFRCTTDPLGLPPKPSQIQNEGGKESNALPLLLISTMRVLRMRAMRANPEQPGELATLLKCHNAVDSALPRGEQVPLPQSTNDPIISIRSHDWCSTPLLLLSSSSTSPTHPEPPGTGSTRPLKHSRRRRRGRRRLWSRI